MPALGWDSWEKAGAVYGLVDMAEPDRIRYVGYTVRHPSERVREHRGGSKGSSYEWVKKVGDRLGYVVLEWVEHEASADSKEQEWYDILTDEGHDLLNAVRPGGGAPEHGLASTYSNWGCRCDLCRQGHASRHRGQNKRRAAKAKATELHHGLAHTYSNWGCRCRACTTANSAARAHRKTNGHTCKACGEKYFSSTYAHQVVCSNLTPERVRLFEDIRDLYKSGLSGPQVASMLDVSYGLVSGYIKAYGISRSPGRPRKSCQTPLP